MAQWTPPNDPGDVLRAVFQAPDVTLDGTLLDALTGTSTDSTSALLREAVAALLNAAHPDVSYGLSQVDVVIQTSNALSGNEAEMLALAEKLASNSDTACGLSPQVSIADGSTTPSSSLSTAAGSQPQDLVFVQDFQGNPPGPGEALADYTLSGSHTAFVSDPTTNPCDSFAAAGVEEPSACVEFTGPQTPPPGEEINVELVVDLELGDNPNVVYRVTNMQFLLGRFASPASELVPQHELGRQMFDGSGRLIYSATCTLDPAAGISCTSDQFISDDPELDYQQLPVDTVHRVRRLVRTKGGIDAANTFRYWLLMDDFRIVTDQVTVLRDVAPEAQAFHARAQTLGLPPPFDVLPFFLVQAPGSTEDRDPLGWASPREGIERRSQPFGPSFFASSNPNLYRFTFEIHSGVDYGADKVIINPQAPPEKQIAHGWENRVVLSLCDGVVIPGNNVTGDPGLGGSAQPGRGVSVRCFMDALDSAFVDSDGDGDPNLSNIVVTYNHFLEQNTIDCALLGSAVPGCSGEFIVADVGDIVLVGTPLGQTAPFEENDFFDHLHLAVFFAEGFAREAGNFDNNAFYLNPLLMYTSDIVGTHIFDASYFDAAKGVEMQDLIEWSVGGFNFAPNGDTLSFFDQPVDPQGNVQWPTDVYPLIPAADPDQVTDFIEYLDAVFTSAKPYVAPNCTVNPDNTATCDLDDLNDDSRFMTIPHP